MIVLYAVFFNGTDNHENYTCRHTLSLHHALPICQRWNPCAPAASNGCSGIGPCRTRPPFRRSPTCCSRLSILRQRCCAFRLQASRALPTASRSCRGSKMTRSEEHTSELQSLMRISYAVFCLKKKHITMQDTEVIIVQ